MILLPTGKSHVSFSEVKNFAECSWRHHLIYIKKAGSDVPNVHLSFGSALHEVIENYLNTKEIDASIGREYMAKYLVDNAANPNFVKYDLEKECSIMESILRDLPKFLDDTFPGWTVTSAEEQLMESVTKLMPDHEGITFKGFIDAVLVTEDPKGKKTYWIIDWKSSGRRWNAREKLGDENFIMQLRLYKKFWSEKHGIPMKDIKCGFVTLVKNEKPGKHCYLYTVSVGDTTANRAIDVVDGMLAAVKAGIKLKNRTACRWCPFKDTPDCP